MITRALALLAFPIFLSAPSAEAAGRVVLPELTVRNFPLTNPGTPIIVGKQFDPKTGMESFISQSPQVKSAADLVAMEAAERAAETAKHGALSESFREHFYAMRDSDWTDIRVSLRYPSFPAALDPETHPLSQVWEREREIEAVKPLGSIKSILARFAGGLRNVEIQDTGVFTCRASKRQLELLRFDPFIGRIDFPLMVSPTSTYALSTLTSSAYNPASGVPSAFRGQGVNAATIECGLGNTGNGSDGHWYQYGNIVSCLNLNPFNIVPSPSTPPWDDWQHSHQTFKCLWQTAPFANLFHKNFRNGSPTGIIPGADADYGSTDNTAFIINNGIQSVSMSVSISDQLGSKSCPSPTYNYPYPYTLNPRTASDPLMIDADEWAFRPPYPVLCNPTANWGSDFEANWQCYNALSVGNVRHTGLTHYEIPDDPNNDLCDPRPSCTQTRNPAAVWGGNGLRPPLYGPDGTQVYWYSSGDREMPYLVAPGITPDAGGTSMVDQNPTCVDGPMFCGTSYSAPIVNGVVACVLSADSRMLNRPHVVWATLLATAENVTDGDWNSNFDGKDGAGVVSGASAITFARNHSEPGINTTAVTDGIASGSLNYAVAAHSNYQYNFLVPTTKPAGKHLRMVLIWTSDPVRGNYNFLSDLDLSVGSENGYTWSDSYNGNVEIVDIPAAQLVAGKAYQAYVNLWANREQGPPYWGITGGTLKYALAWTWVKDHAD